MKPVLTLASGASDKPHPRDDLMPWWAVLGAFAYAGLWLVLLSPLLLLLALFSRPRLGEDGSERDRA